MQKMRYKFHRKAELYLRIMKHLLHLHCMYTSCSAVEVRRERERKWVGLGHISEAKEDRIIESKRR